MNKRYGNQQDDMIELRDIATMLETISNKANQTGARLEKLELLRQQQAQQQSPNDPNKEVTMKMVFDNDKYRPVRPQKTEFHAKKRHVHTKSRDVTIDQIFQALSCLKEEINILNENHDELVQQVNTIKSLIQ